MTSPEASGMPSHHDPKSDQADESAGNEFPIGRILKMSPDQPADQAGQGNGQDHQLDERAHSVNLTPAVRGRRMTLTISVPTTIDEVERQLILATLEWVRGVKKLAAHRLGISLKTLYNKLDRYAQESSCAR